MVIFEMAGVQAIHQRKITNRVDKFNYPRSQLEGSANETAVLLD